MKKIFLLLAAVFAILISACGVSDDEGIFAGAECTFEGAEICSDNGADILLCQSSTWTLKKQCNLSIGKRCRPGADGNLGCFGDGESGGSGNGGSGTTANSDTDNTDVSDSDTSSATEGDTASENPDNEQQTDTGTDTQPGNSDTSDTSDTDTDSSNTGITDTDTDTDTDIDTDTDTDTGDTGNTGGSCNSNSDCSGATPYCSISTSECIANAVFITEYVEGSSNNKAIEIYNGSKSSVDLSNYTIQQANNGESFGSKAIYIYNFPASSQLASGATYVVCDNLAVDSLLSYCDDKPSTGSTLKFNGDDGMALFEGTLKVDQIGIQGDTTPWSVAGIASATKDHTLRRKTTVIQGIIDWYLSAGTTESDSQWEVLSQDTFDGLGTR